MDAQPHDTAAEEEVAPEVTSYEAHQNKTYDRVWQGRWYGDGTELPETFVDFPEKQFITPNFVGSRPRLRGLPWSQEVTYDESGELITSSPDLQGVPYSVYRRDREFDVLHLSKLKDWERKETERLDRTSDTAPTSPSSPLSHELSASEKEDVRVASEDGSSLIPLSKFSTDSSEGSQVGEDNDLQENTPALSEDAKSQSADQDPKNTQELSQPHRSDSVENNQSPASGSEVAEQTEEEQSLAEKSTPPTSSARGIDTFGLLDWDDEFEKIKDTSLTPNPQQGSEGHISPERSDSDGDEIESERSEEDATATSSSQEEAQLPSDVRTLELAAMSVEDDNPDIGEILDLVNAVLDVTDFGGQTSHGTRHLISAMLHRIDVLWATKNRTDARVVEDVTRQLRHEINREKAQLEARVLELESIQETVAQTAAQGLEQVLGVLRQKGSQKEQKDKLFTALRKEHETALEANRALSLKLEQYTKANLTHAADVAPSSPSEQAQQSQQSATQQPAKPLSKSTLSGREHFKNALAAFERTRALINKLPVRTPRVEETQVQVEVR
ncbi:MAG: hypothetical protein Q9162_005149 [Coniocarpon cinnabarinum]